MDKEKTGKLNFKRCSCVEEKICFKKENIKMDEMKIECGIKKINIKYIRSLVDNDIFLRKEVFDSSYKFDGIKSFNKLYKDVNLTEGKEYKIYDEFFDKNDLNYVICDDDDKIKKVICSFFVNSPDNIKLCSSITDDVCKNDVRKECCEKLDTKLAEQIKISGVDFKSDAKEIRKNLDAWNEYQSKFKIKSKIKFLFKESCEDQINQIVNDIYYEIFSYASKNDDVEVENAVVDFVNILDSKMFSEIINSNSSKVDEIVENLMKSNKGKEKVDEKQINESNKNVNQITTEKLLVLYVDCRDMSGKKGNELIEKNVKFLGENGKFGDNISIFGLPSDKNKLECIDLR